VGWGVGAGGRRCPETGRWGPHGGGVSVSGGRRVAFIQEYLGAQGKGNEAGSDHGRSMNWSVFLGFFDY